MSLRYVQRTTAMLLRKWGEPKSGVRREEDFPDLRVRQVQKGKA